VGIKRRSALVASSEAGTLRRWVYLRLIYTETSLKWRQEDFWYRNMAVAFALAVCAGAVLLSSIRRRWTYTQEHLDNASIAAVCLIAIPAFTALTFMVGKYSPNPLRDVVEMHNYGCCTQGMVFPREEVPALLEYLIEEAWPNRFHD